VKGKNSKNNSKAFFKEGFLSVFKASGIDDELLKPVFRTQKRKANDVKQLPILIL